MKGEHQCDKTSGQPGLCTRFGLTEGCEPVQGTLLAGCWVREVFSLHSYVTWLCWQNFKAQTPHSVASSSYLCNVNNETTVCRVGCVLSPAGAAPGTPSVKTFKYDI